MPEQNTSATMRKFFSQTIWNFFADIISGFIGSFDNKRENGFSARKLTAWASMALITYCVLYYVDGTNVIQALIVLCIFVLTLLGLIVIQNIVELVREFKSNKSGHEK